MGTPEENRMSGLPPKDLTQEQLEYLWKDIPEEFRAGKRLRPATIQQFHDFLEQLLCPHPSQAARALGDESGQQEWDASLEQMTNLSGHVCANLAAAALAPSSRLFKVTEIPELSDTKKYEEYRRNLQRFLRANDDPAPHEYGKALERILQQVTDKTANVASATWDTQELTKPTWAETTEHLIRSFDEKFQNHNLLEDSLLAWHHLRIKEGDDVNEFFNKFEAAADQYKLAQIRTNIPAEVRVTMPMVTARLIQILPAYLRNALKMRLSGKTPKQLPETMNLKELRTEIEDLWRYMPKPAATGHNTTRNFQTASGKAAPVHNHITAKEPKTYLCGFHGNYDTSPAVPAKYRGSIFADPRNPANNSENLARKKLCADAGLCINCRRDHSQHPTIGSNFKPIHMNPTARRGPANTESPTNDQGQRLLEAPPTTPA
jgi:hypothetical protein